MSTGVGGIGVGVSGSPSDPGSVRFARAVPGIGALPAGLARELDAQLIPVRKTAGTVICDLGTPCTGLILLERGTLRVSRVGADGRELVLYRVKPGEVCVITLSCLLAGADYTARGVVESDLDGFLIPADVFHRLTAEVAAFRSFAFAAYTERVNGLLDLAAAIAFDRLDQRLATALLQRVDSTGRLELPVTHAELAGEIGTVRERVSRLLGRFESRGAVSLGRGRIMVRDKSRLRAIAQRAD